MGLTGQYTQLKKNVMGITGMFETSLTSPECFGRVAGNFDNMGISFGVLQYNFGWESATPIFQNMFNNQNLFMRDALGSRYQEFYNVCFNYSTAQKVAWGDSISLITADPSTNKHDVIQPWKQILHDVGVSDACQGYQVDAAQWFYDQALAWFKEFGFWSEQAFALLFDISVQNGSISQAVKDQINAATVTFTQAKDPKTLEVERMKIVANKRADAATASYKEIVRERKLAIANGSGWVYNHSLYVDCADFNVGLKAAITTDDLKTVMKDAYKEEIRLDRLANPAVYSDPGYDLLDRWLILRHAYLLDTFISGAAGGGTITKNPDKASYSEGEAVTVTAVPNVGHTFTGWSGAISGGTNPQIIVMNGRKSITATFT